MFWLIQRVAGVSLLRREERAAWRERKRLEEGLYNARTDRASDTTPADRNKEDLRQPVKRECVLYVGTLMEADFGEEKRERVAGLLVGG